MYMIPEMIEMGLEDWEKFPTEDHRVVAMNIALCNSDVTTRDQLMEIVHHVIRIPTEKIKTITLAEMPQEVRHYVRMG